MRRCRALVVLALVTLVFTVRSSAQNADSNTFVTGQILVKFRPGLTSAAQADVHRQAGGTQLAEIARTRVQLVSVPAGDERGAIARYLRNPNVVIAEPNFVRRVDGPSTVAAVIPRDYHFREQYALHNTGQEFYCLLPDFCFYVGTPDADIDAPEAWEVSTGTAIKVAVIDTGIDAAHPDLAPTYGGGYNFIIPGADPIDDHHHGTHVSGTIAAALNNLTGSPAAEEGVVGIAPNARILAYKVCDANGECSDSAIQDAIARAIADGAKVINMSLGSYEYSQSLNDSVQDAWAAGLVIVAGAGNDSTTAPFYPAAFDNVISVGASDEDDRRASFSNYGNWVDVAAPGNIIMSTYPMWGCGVGTTPGDLGCYAWSSGTSMATPHVAGAAALVWSRSDVSTNAHVVDMLLNSTDGSGVGSVRLDSWTIHGRLNLYGAMTHLAPPPVSNLPPVANAGPDQTWTDSDGDNGVMVMLNGSLSNDPDGNPITYQWRENGTLLASMATPNIFFTVGTHTVTLEVTDTHGANGTDAVVITIEAAPSPPPTLSVSAISPNTVGQNAGTTTFVVTGTAFAPGATVSFAGGAGKAPRVLSVTRDSATQLTVRAEIKPGGPKAVRRWDVVVTNPGGASAVGDDLLTITP